MRKEPAVAGILLLILMLLLVPHIYLDSEFGVGGQVVWTDAECFIFYEVAHGGFKTTPFQLLRVLVGGGMPFSHSRANVFVFHIHGGVMDSHVVSNFQVGTTIVPYRGALYLLDCLGCGPNPNLTERRSYRWDGSNFVQISSAEADVVRAAFPEADPLRKRARVREQGWHHEFIAFNGEPQKIEFSQGDVNYVLEVRQPSEKKAVISLQELGKEETLATHRGGMPHVVSAKDYRAIFLP